MAIGGKPPRGPVRLGSCRAECHALVSLSASPWSFVSKIIPTLRASLFVLGLWISLLLYLPIMLVLRLLPVHRRHRILSGWNWMAVHWLRITCGVRWTVEGEMPEGGGVIIANHQSTWETFFLPLIVNGPVFVLKRELMRVPIFGLGLSLGHPIAIDRSAGREALKQLLQQGSERLAEGRWVVVFPEGTRSAVGEPVKYKPGGAMLATRNGARVVLVAHNAGCFWPRGSLIKRPGVITFRIGPVIETAGRGAAEVNAEAEAWTQAQLATMPCPARRTES
ncbi:MAG: 1-acyl-sn-glycerol-3-phosphate acyltransferase [Halothiobacillaceae bacterium]|nr:MAG: 1-acyl-sn-glycerol-3-phosphate acyltransferase [Halothiobacillaceae bacterium]